MLARLEGDDIVLCQITSGLKFDKYSIPLSRNDFQRGGLHLESTIRANKLLTAEKSTILYKTGTLKDSKLRQITAKVCDILKA